MFDNYNLISLKRLVGFVLECNYLFNIFVYLC